MKKINFLKLLLICVFCISAMFVFVACGDCEHEYGDWKTISQATCLTEGSEERICKNCGEKEFRNIPVFLHEQGDKIAYDIENHWYKCKYGCEKKYEEEPHLEGNQIGSGLLKHGYLCSKGCAVVVTGEEHRYNTNNVCIDCNYALPYTTGLDINGGYVEGIGTATDKDVVIPAYHDGQAVTSIRSCAFSHLNITSVIVPETVTLIRNCAFEFCDKLTSVYISSNVSEIEPAAFYENKSLNTIIVSEENSNYMSHDGSLYTKDGKILLACSAKPSLVMLDSVEYIERHAGGGLQIETIHFSKNLKGIGTEAFWHNDALSEVIFSEGLLTIGEYAFFYCGNLQKVVMPDTVVDVERSAFYYCEKLVDVKFSNSITVLKEASFMGCKIQNLKLPQNLTIMERSCLSVGYNHEIVLPATLEKIDVTSIMGNNIGKIVLPANLVDIAENALSILNIKEIIVDPQNPAYKTIDGNLFSKDGSILYRYVSKNGETKYVIPQGVRRIATDAIARAFSVEEFVLPDSIEEIGEGAFAFCISLKKINIPQGTKVISNGTFTGCDNLENIVIDEGVKRIDRYAFYVVKNLKKVTIPSTVAEIEGGSFAGCENLQTIEVSSNNSYFKFENGALLSKDGKTMFAVALDGKSEYTIPNGVKTIERSVFEQMTLLKKINLNNVEHIEDAAFVLSGIEDLVLPESIKYVGFESFGWCESLKTVKINSSQEITFGSFAFCNCSQLNSFEISTENVKTEEYNWIFSECYNLSYITIQGRIKYFGADGNLNI